MTPVTPHQHTRYTPLCTPFQSFVRFLNFLKAARGAAKNTETLFRIAATVVSRERTQIFVVTTLSTAVCLTPASTTLDFISICWRAKRVAGISMCVYVCVCSALCLHNVVVRVLSQRRQRMSFKCNFAIRREALFTG